MRLRRRYLHARRVYFPQAFGAYGLPSGLATGGLKVATHSLPAKLSSIGGLSELVGGSTGGYFHLPAPDTHSLRGYPPTRGGDRLRLTERSLG
jgi:hypothetical protein